jgi:hypothetical protein
MNCTAKRRDRAARFLLVASFALPCAGVAVLANGADKKAAHAGTTTHKLTSSNGVTTEVRREVRGKLTEDDVEQVSFLAAHLLQHFDAARGALQGGDPEKAADDIGHAEELLVIIKRLLPVIKMTVVVKDQEGAKLYEDIREVQPNEIPLLQVSAAIDFLQPIVEAKQQAAEATGVKLTHRDLLRASLSLNLRHVEQSLRKATHQLNARDTERAASTLAALEAEAIDVTVEQDDSPLGEIREALVYAHRALSSHNYAEARANLATAREQLALYRDVLPDEDQAQMEGLAKEIETLDEEIAQPTPDSHGQTLGRLGRLFQKLSPNFQQTKPRKSESSSDDAPTVSKPRSPAERK